MIIYLAFSWFLLYTSGSIIFSVQVKGVTADNVKIVRIEFHPTVPHCSLATLIGLCIRVQLERTVAHTNPFKLDIYIKKGTHNTEEESKHMKET